MIYEVGQTPRNRALSNGLRWSAPLDADQGWAPKRGPRRPITNYTEDRLVRAISASMQARWPRWRPARALPCTDKKVPKKPPDLKVLDWTKINGGPYAVFVNGGAGRQFETDVSSVLAHSPPPISLIHGRHFSNWGQPAENVRDVLILAGWKGVSGCEMGRHCGEGNSLMAFAAFCGSLGFAVRVRRDTGSTHTAIAIGPMERRGAV